MAGRRYVVIGAGGHAKVVIATIESAGDAVIGVLDDDPQRLGQMILGAKVLGSVTATQVPDGAVAVIAIGDNRARKAVADRLKVSYASVVHPSAIVHESVTIGEGSVVFAGAIIQPDSVIGAHAIVNTGASIDHDNRIGAFAHVAPGSHLSGSVSVGEGALIGIGSAVIPGTLIGEWAVVGAGSAAVANVPANVTVGGTPARPLSKEK